MTASQLKDTVTGKGRRYPAESSIEIDTATGARIRQITSAAAIHHHPFFYIPAYDQGMRWLVFVSHRTGTPQIFVEERASGELIQLTDRDDLGEWSIHPSPDGRYVYFTAGSGAWRVNIETYEEEQLADFGSAEMRGPGMVAAGMGTTTMTRDGRWWAIKFSDGAESCLAIVDTVEKRWETILRRDEIAHMMFSPDDDTLLFYAGPLTDRVWVINRDGSNNRRLYTRKPGEWITHETWIPGTRELAITDWPKGVRAIDPVTGAERQVTTFNAWHPIANHDGTLMVADTTFPDNGIQLFDPRDGVGDPHLLCLSNASNMGAHWGGPFPYDNGPISMYAPQHTHPHPSFAPDSSRLVFTSDKTGFAQLYEVEVPAEYRG
ncbi:oligogalacturonate lyase [soil metagenome]